MIQVNKPFIVGVAEAIDWWKGEPEKFHKWLHPAELFSVEERLLIPKNTLIFTEKTGDGVWVPGLRCKFLDKKFLDNLLKLWVEVKYDNHPCFRFLSEPDFLDKLAINEIIT